MNTWDYRFIKLAHHISFWSKDPSTQVAAIAVKDRRILATGYNGFPKGIDDDVKALQDRPTKLKLMVHGEMNMIFNAVEHGVNLKDATVYVYGLPVCEDCFKGLIQIGIKRVVMPEIKTHGGKWKEGCRFAKSNMTHVGIQVDQYNPNHLWKQEGGFEKPEFKMYEDCYDEIEECENGY
tara:strand:+ start:419 stop:955 length:537 start_codon:yes stop_codon:yes gene_type:complete